MCFKKLYKIKIGTVLLLFVSAVSCGSYQSGTVSDGIYNSDNQSDQVIIATDDVELDSNSYYKNFFKEKRMQYETMQQEAITQESEIFTDVESYNTEKQVDTTYVENVMYSNYNTGYAGWGQESDNVTVNVYNYDNFWSPYYYNPYAYWGRGYSGWNWGFSVGWGWGYGYYGPSYYNPWYPNYGWGYYPPSYWGGYYDPYYGHNSYYRGVSYNATRRTSAYNTGLSNARRATTRSNVSRATNTRGNLANSRNTNTTIRNIDKTPTRVRLESTGTGNNNVIRRGFNSTRSSSPTRATRTNQSNRNYSSPSRSSSRNYSSGNRSFGGSNSSGRSSSGSRSGGRR